MTGPLNVRSTRHIGSTTKVLRHSERPGPGAVPARRGPEAGSRLNLSGPSMRSEAQRAETARGPDLVFNALLGAADYLGVKGIPSASVEGAEQKALQELARTGLACIIWIRYMKISRRVNATFVRT